MNSNFFSILFMPWMHPGFDWCYATPGRCFCVKGLCSGWNRNSGKGNKKKSSLWRCAWRRLLVSIFSLTRWPTRQWWCQSLLPLPQTEGSWIPISTARGDGEGPPQAGLKPLTLPWQTTALTTSLLMNIGYKHSTLNIILATSYNIPSLIQQTKIQTHKKPCARKQDLLQDIQQNTTVHIISATKSEQISSVKMSIHFYGCS